MIISYTFAEHVTFLFFVPFCIIIPMSIRMRYYRGGMTKLSSYIVVFLEKNSDVFYWETRNKELVKIKILEQIKSIL